MRPSFALAMLSLIGAPLILARPLPDADSHDILARSIADAVVDALVQRDFDTRDLMDRSGVVSTDPTSHPANLRRRDDEKKEKRNYFSRRAAPAHSPAAPHATVPDASDSTLMRRDHDGKEDHRKEGQSSLSRRAPAAHATSAGESG